MGRKTSALPASNLRTATVYPIEIESPMIRTFGRSGDYLAGSPWPSADEQGFFLQCLLLVFSENANSSNDAANMIPHITQFLCFILLCFQLDIGLLLLCLSANYTLETSYVLLHFCHLPRNKKTIQYLQMVSLLSVFST